jgi:hypothetical protein
MCIGVAVQSSPLNVFRFFNCRSDLRIVRTDLDSITRLHGDRIGVPGRVVSHHSRHDWLPTFPERPLRE